jgi:thiaminase/transcriptional activator TenA
MRRRELIFLPLAAGAAGKFTSELWAGITSIYAKTLAHPFLAGLASGSLPRRKFRFYLVQDALYLAEFSRALNVLASKSPKPEWALALSRDTIETIEAERRMHKEILASYAVTASEITADAMAPLCYAYTNHLLIACERRSFAEGLAAMLPCYWIYWEVGKHLKKRRSPEAAYQRWIDQYADAEYGQTVQRVLGMMDEQAATSSAASKERMKRLFTISARYEYLFWDMAWREEQWAP